jgi:hypothetical protein
VTTPGRIDPVHRAVSANWRHRATSENTFTPLSSQRHPARVLRRGRRGIHPHRAVRCRRPNRGAELGGVGTGRLGGRHARAGG